MKKLYRRWIRLFVVVAVVTVGCQSGPDATKHTYEIEGQPGGLASQIAQTAEETADVKPKRIILFIGDGMGLSAVTASSYAAGEPLAMLGMERFGVMATHEYEFVTTDSAASATAKATGEKTHFNAVSVTPSTGPKQEEDQSHQLRTVVEAAQEAGWRTGLAATVRINHATPAPFAAHRHARHQYEDIALDMSKAGVDVLMGAGWQYFRHREDERDLLAEMERQGYVVAGDGDAVRQAAPEASRLVGLMHERDMPWVEEDDREMELDEMVTRSIEVLDRDKPEGFFLMVEGSRIDWGGHRMDGRRVVEETLDMDRAVAAALQYARERDDTLVAVTSDHETGAMDVLDGATAAPYLEELGEDDTEVAALTMPEQLDEDRRAGLAGPYGRLDVGEGTLAPPEAQTAELLASFGFMSGASRAYWDGEGRFSAIHTPQLVPLFADGPGADELVRVRDNADLGRQLIGWIDGEEPDVDRADRLERKLKEAMPDNVIMVVADGLGMSSVTALYYRFGIPSLLRMPKVSAVATHPRDGLVADAPAAATALATGAHTRTGAVGMEPGADGEELEPRASAMQQAMRGDRATGFVSTATVTDPTAAAMFAHQQQFGDREDVARQFVELHEPMGGLDFLAAGGSGDLDAYRDRLEQRGVTISDDWLDGDSDGPTYHLLADGALAPASQRQSDDDQPTLAEMSARAIDGLGDSDDGFFLVIDAAGLGAQKTQLERGEPLFAELAELDEAVEQIRQFVAERDDTLVIVTSLRDHTMSVLDNHYGFHNGNCGALIECGGEFEMEWFGVAADEIRHGQGLHNDEMQGEFAPPQIAVQYTWPAQMAAEKGAVQAPFSANFVPLFAEGPTAGGFDAFIEQHRLGQWLVDWAQ